MLKDTKYKASKQEIIAASIMGGVTLLSQFHAFLRYCFPSIAKEKVDIFLKPSFSMPLEVEWYMKMIIDPLVPTSTYYILAFLIKDIYPKLFYIAMILAIYNTMDIVLFAWDYKTNDVLYDFMLFITVVAIITIISIKNKKMKKLK